MITASPTDDWLLYALNNYSNILIDNKFILWKICNIISHIYASEL